MGKFSQPLIMEIKPTYTYSLEGQESERLLYRRITEEDFDTWLRFCAYPDSLKYIFSPIQLEEVDPVARCKIWFDKVFHRYSNGLGGMNALIEKSSGAFVGQCGLLIQTVEEKEELEIGYSLMPEFRNQGYAIEAAKTCKEFVFANNYRESLISMVHVDNMASAKVAMKNGMVLDKTINHHGDPVNIFRVYRG